jgi:hypothetical protein
VPKVSDHIHCYQFHSRFASEATKLKSIDGCVVLSSGSYITG